MREVVLDPYLRFAAYDLAMDLVLLWASAAIVRRRVRWYRLLAGGMLGAVYGLWLALARDGILPGGALTAVPAGYFAVHFAVIPLAMLIAAFAPLARRDLFRLFGIFLIVAILSYGLANAFYYLLAGLHRSFSGFFLLLLQIGLALGVAEMGWGAVHRQAILRLCRVPLLIELGHLSVETVGYLDTGNHLCDPVTRHPVIILDYHVVRDLLTPGARSFVEAVAESADPPDLPEDDPWTLRLRILPYRAVQRRAGLLPGLRADRVCLGEGDRRVCRGPAIVALEMAGHLRHDAYRALVPPGLWSWAAVPARRRL